MVDWGIDQNRTENCINARSALLQKFSDFFYLVDNSINQKNIRFIFNLSYHFCFIAWKQTLVLTLLNAGLLIFQNLRSRWCTWLMFFGWLKNHLNFSTSQNECYTVNLTIIKYTARRTKLDLIKTDSRLQTAKFENHFPCGQSRQQIICIL